MTPNIQSPGDAPTLVISAVRLPAPGQLPHLDSRQLFCQGNTIGIDHNGQRYQLRVTRENKLILTK